MLTKDLNQDNKQNLKNKTFNEEARVKISPKPYENHIKQKMTFIRKVYFIPQYELI